MLLSADVTQRVAYGYLWQGSVVAAEVAPLSKVEKVANRQRGNIASAQPTTTYELSVFEEVLQEYIVERVLSPPTAPAAVQTKPKKNKNKPDTTTTTTTAPLDELPQRVLQLYQQSIQAVQAAMLE
jgi:hypothetical protein